MITQKFLKFAALLLIDKFHSNLWDFIFCILQFSNLQKKKKTGLSWFKSFYRFFLGKIITSKAMTKFTLNSKKFDKKTSIMIIFAGINGLVTKAKERKLIDLFQVLISNNICTHFKVSCWRTRHSKSLFRVSSRMKIMRMTEKVELNQLPFYFLSKIYHVSIDRTSGEWWHYENADEKKKVSMIFR